MIKVAIVDDEPGILEYLRLLLDGDQGVRLVGIFDAGLVARKEIPLLRPQVAIVDLELKDIPGIEVIEEISRKSPETNVLVYTKFDDDESLFPALRAGAVGYLLKGEPPEIIIKAVHAAQIGEAPMTGRLARRILKEVARPAKKYDPNEATGLSDREKEVLGQLAMGLTVGEAARKLFIAESTVKSHAKNIYKKLCAHSRITAINTAREKGILF